MLESDEEFGTAYETYSKPIYRFFYWRTQSRDLSEDLTSNVFEKAWRSRASFRGGSVQAWLYRIARNLLIDHWRTRKEVPLDDEATLPSEAISASDNFDQRLMEKLLMVALNKLPSDMHQVISMRFLEGLTTRQVACKLQLSESNIRVIQYRGLKKLRSYLDEK